MIRAARLIAAKDLRLMRGREALPVQALLLGLLIIFMFSLSQNDSLTPGACATIFWISSLLCQALISPQLFYWEQPNNTRLGLCAAPIAPQAVWLGKTLAGLILLLLCQFILLPVLLLLLQQNLAHFSPTALCGLILADLGLAGLVTLLAAFPANSSRHALVAILGFPLLIPLFLAAIRLSQTALAPIALPMPDPLPWLGLLAAFDALTLGVGLLLFPLIFRAS